MLAGRLIVDDLTSTDGGAAGAASSSAPGHGECRKIKNGLPNSIFIAKPQGMKKYIITVSVN